jgi:probable H4MPT-linked C1 transfer pathway protein
VNAELIGWDIGGAHLKAAASAGGQVLAVSQKPCLLWQGMHHFHEAVEETLKELSPTPDCRHAVTMTGELVDRFANREEGVLSLIRAMETHCTSGSLVIFAGRAGFLEPGAIDSRHIPDIASANWMATGFHAASRIRDALLIDIGSTTTDLLLVQRGEVQMRGYTDFERMRYDELIYSGIVRTPLMALARRAPFEGEWVGLMAEHFATTADVYRLCGELPEHADQMPTADGGAKTVPASARRIARLLGRDAESAEADAWERVARFFRGQQLGSIALACERQLSRGLLNRRAPFVGAGVGRFLVQELATRLQHPYVDFADLFPVHARGDGFHIADCAPAAAVAMLAQRPESADPESGTRR